jgi:hypothetical protein
MVRFFFWMILAWGLAGNAVAQMAKLDTLCDRQELFVNQTVPDLPWQPTRENKVELPVRSTCWVRLTRPVDGDAAGANQFLRFDNSWGSNFSLYSATGELLAKSTVAGERYRTLADKIRVYFPLEPGSPSVLYARVDSVNNFFKVRHSFTQVDGNAVVARQRRDLQDVAAGWAAVQRGRFFGTVLSVSAQPRLRPVQPVCICVFHDPVCGPRGSWCRSG